MFHEKLKERANLELNLESNGKNRFSSDVWVKYKP